ncbi:hypothetical protein IDH44_08985 [Paenibacillus sp. IB182496]|uniref:SGNH hydrolase-type esterase domain-containing protein n=1 Tax=Paenibacillus sabuli TaxID=2772509 RepID=A0A927BRB3_9BACL|nr:SGNH/GDSL hydrolase family protein [Paenibacillus sabuli]MBD2845323.1 hypothetical protein [Paenibacillus sabuli]
MDYDNGSLRSLDLQRGDSLEQVVPEALARGRFSIEVWRVLISRDYAADREFQVAYHGIDCFGEPVHPPPLSALPAKRWLAYGSSITHGAGATVHSSSYIQQAARRLGVDVLNKGLGGACLCEPEVAAHFADLDTWDWATLELGVNMRGLFTTAQFEQRARAFVQRMLRPGKPVVLIDMFPNASDYAANPNDPMRDVNREFREALWRIHDECANPKLHIISGEQLLPVLRLLTVDLIHPSDDGHIEMGRLLAERLRRLLPEHTAVDPAVTNYGR